jgi:hypothetical protein
MVNVGRILQDNRPIPSLLEMCSGGKRPLLASGHTTESLDVK